MFDQEFIRNALIAGSAIAVASGAVGYFVVLRAQVFAGDALGHVAFTGVLAAALAGVDLRIGLFVATGAIALLFGGLGDRARADDVAIGVVFSWVLGLGALFLDLFNNGAGGENGVVAARTLFGSIFDLGVSQTELAAAIAIAVLVGIGMIGRPLLFATLDPGAAAARGVPVRTVGVVFLVLVGIDAGEATQAVGALLLLGLLAAPAGAAVRLTATPIRGLALAILFGFVSIWLGIAAAYLDASLPPSSAIVGVAAAIYALAFLATAPPVRRRVLAR
jgi:zinc/manganese transport system permease protein